MRRALITGITGQDGSYLAELLLGKGYEVHGIVRRSSSIATGRLNHMYSEPDESGQSGPLCLHYGDMLDPSSLRRAISAARPDEIYNLAAQSHVMVSFKQPEYTFAVNAGGAISLFEAARELAPEARIYQAGSSEMFGNQSAPQNERTPFDPRSPYAVSKVAAHYAALQYRHAYGLRISNGILFNHESERRGETFVTRKITRGLARIKSGLQERLILGNIEAVRDWGHAEDYVRAMWLMLQHERADDFVVGTGSSETVKEFLHLCCQYFSFRHWPVTWNHHSQMRPAEVNCLRADAGKAKNVLGWTPRVDLKGLVLRMCENDGFHAEMESRRLSHACVA